MTSAAHRLTATVLIYTFAIAEGVSCVDASNGHCLHLPKPKDRAFAGMDPDPSSQERPQVTCAIRQFYRAGNAAQVQFTLLRC